MKPIFPPAMAIGLFLLCSFAEAKLTAAHPAYSETDDYIAAYAPHPRSLYEWTANLRAPEKERIRAHLLFVERYLRARQGPGLSRSQKTLRARMLDILAEYRERGVFPGNESSTAIRPVFIDPSGAACAVGHLIRESGHTGLADKVRSTDNNVYLPDLEDPAFVAWAHAHGLSPGECALIQPAYCKHPMVGPSDFYREIRKVSVDGAGNIWVGSRHGAVAMWNGEQWTRYGQHAQAYANVAQMAFTADGKPVVYLRQSSQPLFFPQGQAPYPSLRDIAGMVSGKNGIWVFGTMPLDGKPHVTGLHKLGADFAVTSFPLASQRRISDVAIAADRDIWTLSTDEVRIFREASGWKLLKKDPSLNSMSGAAAGLGDEMLLGRDGFEAGIFYHCENCFSRRGFARMKAVDDSVTLIAEYTSKDSPLPSDSVYGVAADSATQTYWIATERGLAQLDLQGNWKVPAAFKDVISVDRDAEGGLWLGMRNGYILKSNGAVWDTLPGPGVVAGLRTTRNLPAGLAITQADDRVTIRLPGSLPDGAFLEIRNMQGRILWRSQDRLPASLDIPASRFQPGIYGAWIKGAPFIRPARFALRP